jgi:transposase
MKSESIQPQSQMWQAQLQMREDRIKELERHLWEAQALLAEQRKQIEALQEEVSELKRTGKRQATPFARGKHKKKRKRPGRTAGKGKFNHREKPKEEEIDETKEAALPCCPQCDGEVEDVKEHEHFEEDIPPVKPVLRRYVTYSGYCAGCGERVRSRHPEQISDATGAAGVVIGPRAKGFAADMKHRLGLSYEKVQELMDVGFGLKMSRGGWYQADQRLGEQGRGVYEELIEAIRQSAVVHGDETGWRIGTLSAWLWVFTNSEMTVYTIASGRGHEVVVNILDTEFKGVLVSDRFSAYDHKALAEWLKQKCLSHLLRNASEIEAKKKGAAVRFPRAVTALLREALALKKEKPTLEPTLYRRRAQALESHLDKLIDKRRRFSDPDNKRFARQLRKQRPHLLRFLYIDALDATNNQAERMLRPAVITRKTGGCNRTEQGAATHAILSSILVTCRQQAISIIDFLVELQRADVPPALLPP